MLRLTTLFQYPKKPCQRSLVAAHPPVRGFVSDRASSVRGFVNFN
jgi:hypothetical protein